MKHRKISKEIIGAAAKSRKNYIKSIKDEYALLQTKIDKYGESSLRYKQFAITIALGLGYFAVKERSIWISLTGASVSAIFLINEFVNNTYLNVLVKRAFQLERGVINPMIRTKLYSPQIAHSVANAKDQLPIGIMPLLRSMKSILKSPLTIMSMFTNWNLYMIYWLMIIAFLVIFLTNIHYYCVNTDNRHIVPRSNPIVVNQNGGGDESGLQIRLQEAREQIL